MALFLQFLAEQWLLATALLVLVGLLLRHEAGKSGPSVTPQQAINLVNAEDGVFLDLRDAGDYKQGHIADAIHIPAARLGEHITELDKYRERPLVLVCKMGQQSGAAGKRLREAGYEKVYKLAGGMMEWNNLQLPTVTR